jgi:predicted SprT family Zn-dependent metalloprotease
VIDSDESSIVESESEIEESELESDLEAESEVEDMSSPKRQIKATTYSHQKTKSTFKVQSQRERLSKSTFDDFNSIVFENALDAVEVTWSKRLITTAGITRLRRRKCGSFVEHIAAIELSVKLIDDESRLQSTLMHEMCHAAAWLVDNVHKPPHGKCFKKWANLAMRRVNGLLVSTTHEYVTNTFKHAWACTNDACDFVIQRHSRSIDVNRHCCGRCRQRLIEIEVPVPGAVTTAYTPKQRRVATGFSLFVKENSQFVRSKLSANLGSSGAKVSQTEVMKECGRLWKELKNQQKV